MASVSQIRRMMQMATPHQETVTDDAVASFVTDFPAPAMVKAEFSPVQDLHGYANPWPAGGGKNKLNVIGTDTDNGYVASYYLKSDGTLGGNGNYIGFITEYIPLSAETQYMLSSASGSSPSICFYDNSKQYISGIAYSKSSGTVNIAITMPANTAYCRASVPNAYKDAMMLELGSTATSYEPFENVCPITGWTEAKIRQANENLIDVEPTGGRIKYWYYDTGFLLKAGATYTLKSNGPSGVALYFRGLADAPYPATLTVTGNGSSLVTCVASEDTLVGLKSYAATADVYPADFMLFLTVNGNADIVAHRGQTIAVDWESSAGTVYGGYIQLNEDGSGVLVDYCGPKYMIDGTQSFANIRNKTDSNGNPFTTARFSISQRAPNLSIVNPNAVCSMAKTISVYYTWQNQDISGPGLFTVNNDNMAISLPGTYADKAALQAYFTANPAEVVYEKQTKTSYPLSASQIKTLLGTNNVWTSLNGSVTVGYFKKQ